MNSYEEKQQRRKEKLEAAADRAEASSNASFERADLREEKSGIPLGQPILIGHHSERRHRKAIERADNAMSKAVSEQERADVLRSRAASVGTGGISSDDPDAVKKLDEKLEKLQAKQTKMKTNNRILRKWHKKGVTPTSEGTDFDTYFAELKAVYPDSNEKLARMLIEPDCHGCIGHASYELTNNNAKIKATVKRIEQLNARQTMKTERHIVEGVCSIVFNVEENRVQFIFDGKPSDEVRALLKRNSFRWAPSQGAWQRQLNNSARYVVKSIVKQLKA